MNLINLLQAVFKYESNRPFNEHWYGKTKIEKLELRVSKNAPADFPDIERDFPSAERYLNQITELKDLLPDYVAAIRAQK